MMTVIMDVLILCFCTATSLYCYLLSRQIKKLRDVRYGLGASIGEMVHATQEMNHAFERTRQGVIDETDKLRDLIDEGGALVDYLRDLYQTAQKTADDLKKPHTFPATRITRSEWSEDTHFRKDPLDEVMPKGLERLRPSAMPQKQGVM